MTERQYRDTLPENAMRELREGEEYEPMMPAESSPREVNLWSVCWGILMAVIFSAAAAYLGLKVGQVFEAAIPITIIAVGLSSATRRKNALGENVIIQSIGACSGVVVAGAIFTLPALYILQAKYPEMTVNFLEVFLASLLGGILGILFLIPFRKYFVKEMHGKYPFPEATAGTQVLVSGERGGDQAKPLMAAGLLGGLYDFAVATFGLWHENFTSRALLWGDTVAEKAKMVLKCNTSAAVLGMGYIVGLKYAFIICCGSALVWWVIVPCIALLFPELEVQEGLTAAMASPEDIFKYAKSIGIGGIAMAGIIGIVKSRSIIADAVRLVRTPSNSPRTPSNSPLKGENKDAGAVNSSPYKGEAGRGSALRTQMDLPMKFVTFGILLALALTFLFFHLDVMGGNWTFSIVAILVVGIITFLFTTVAANAIAIVGTNPVSGMTLMTLILASVIMVGVGLSGTSGMVAALIMGGVVCTALSMSGGFVTDLKIGYWLGSTPRKQETWKFLGTLVSAATVAGVIMILNKTYGFTDGTLSAPQANAMAAVIEPLMSGSGAPWLLYGIGALIALVLNAFGVSALAFALGMFIPLELNLPLLVGGAINWFVTTRSSDQKLNAARGERGTLLASGFIAGGALMGVLSAALKWQNVSFDYAAWWQNPLSELLSLGMYCILIIYMVRASMRAKA